MKLYVVTAGSFSKKRIIVATLDLEIANTVFSNSLHFEDVYNEDDRSLLTFDVEEVVGLNECYAVVYGQFSDYEVGQVLLDREKALILSGKSLYSSVEVHPLVTSKEAVQLVYNFYSHVYTSEGRPNRFSFSLNTEHAVDAYMTSVTVQGLGGENIIFYKGSVPFSGTSEESVKERVFKEVQDLKALIRYKLEVEGVSVFDINQSLSNQS
jgi:hypothetical protein